MLSEETTRGVFVHIVKKALKCMTHIEKAISLEDYNEYLPCNTELANHVNNLNCVLTKYY